jgi:uncharacterized protein YcaQ
MILTWQQVAAWRLSNQHLVERAQAKDVLKVVQDLGALHAQLMSAAELSLWARIEELPPDYVEKALWEKRTLVKTWAMRGTLHLVPAEDFPLMVGALRGFDHFRKGAWLKYFGVTVNELEAIMEGVHAILTNTGMTREALADALATHAGNPHLKEMLVSGWGALLKPAAFQGYLCFAPNQGQNVTFVRPDLWLGWARGASSRSPRVEDRGGFGGYEDVPPSNQAFQEILMRYLTAFGPATPEDFARWWGLQPAPAKKIFKAAGDAIMEVEVEGGGRGSEGWKAYLPTKALDMIQKMPEPEGVHLLPFFDPYVVALPRSNDYFLDEAHKAKVYRQQGWISPVVLVDGRIMGVWEQEKQKSKTVLTVTLFEEGTKRVKDGIEAEGERMGTFLGSEVNVAYL